jgi:uncharacterized protein YneF (UPF0154 family)
VVYFTEEDPHAVEGLLMYLYTMDYPDWATGINESRASASNNKSLTAPNKSTVPDAAWETHLAIFKLTDKVFLRALKVMAKKRLQSTMQEEWSLANFPRLLQQLWSMEQEGVQELKATVLFVVSANAGVLAQRVAFQDIVTEEPRFAIDLIQRMAAEANSKPSQEKVRSLIALNTKTVKEEAEAEVKRHKKKVDDTKGIANNRGVNPSIQISQI